MNFSFFEPGSVAFPFICVRVSGLGSETHMASNYIAKKIALLQQETVTQALNAFTNMAELKQIHPHVLKSNLTPDIFHFITCRLLTFAAISDSGDLNYAQTLFTAIKSPDRFMYNTMIRDYSLSTHPIESLKLYIQMLSNGISPNHITYPFVIRSCSLRCLPVLGQQLHSHVLRFGFCLDVFVVNNLISMYCSSGELGHARSVFDECFSVVNTVSWTTLITGYSDSGDVDMARKFFDEMPSRNVVSWGAMIYGYACNGRILEARELFDEMPDKNADLWSVMVSGYSQCGMGKEALELFSEMVRIGVVPNESTLVSVVTVCAQLRALEQGEWLHGYIEEQMFEIDVGLGTSLVDMYGKCGDVKKAYCIFRAMLIKNVAIWGVMISALFLNGCGKQALALFWRIQEMGPTPNNITFIGVLNGCSHAGMVHEGLLIFEMMTRDYHIKPQSEHYGCMVDLLGRAGLIKEALDFVERMAVEPDPGLWGALVSACRIHGETEIGEEVGKLLIEMEKKHSGRYTLLSNMFAAANRWDDVSKVRNLLKEREVLKTPGNSIVEV